MIELPKDFLPKPEEDAKERTIQEAVRLFRQSHALRHRRPGFLLARQWPAFAAGAVAMLVIFALVQVAVPPALKPVQSGDANAIVLAEMQRLFGNRLEGVIQESGNLQPVVSTGDIFAPSQPVLISLRIGGRDIHVITFSGSTIELTAGSQSIRLSPMISENGGVIVEGTNFIWEKGQNAGRLPEAFTARPMERAL